MLFLPIDIPKIGSLFLVIGRHLLKSVHLERSSL